jgi:DNA modification methylase
VTARWEVREGDCVETMAAMAEASVDSVVCDPPYGLEFMGKGWDSFRVDDPGTERHRGDNAGAHGDNNAGNPTFPAAGRVMIGGGKRPTTFRCVGCGKRDQFRNDHACAEPEWRRELIDPHAAPPTMLAFQEWARRWALAAKRVLKPGGHLLAFGGTRTYHRLACAIEDAGFEIRDCVAWMYGSGFPKSLDVSKAIDRAAGVEREIVGQGENWGASTAEDGKTGYGDYAGEWDVTAPATPEAERWQGWGTALKPAHEPVVVARKPLSGTVAGNVLQHGTGALNVDDCRIDAGGETISTPQSDPAARTGEVGQAHTYSRIDRDDFNARQAAAVERANSMGRWPANVVLDQEAGRMLDEQTGELTSGSGQRRPREWQSVNAYGFSERPNGASDYERDGDRGGASRFFFCPLDSGEHPRFRYCAKASSAERSAGLPEGERSGHPTVKPIDLMRWLVRLVTPPDGLVLDPFCGSGTTGCAAVLEGFRFVGCERDAEYVRIARARIAFWSAQPEGADVDVVLAADAKRRGVADTGQLDLLGGA